MADEMTNLYDIACEKASFGSPEWRERLSELVLDVATSTIAYQLSGRFQRAFGCDDLAQDTVKKLLSWINSPDETKPLTRSYVSTSAQSAVTDAMRHYMARKRMPDGGFAECVAKSSANFMNEIGGNARTPMEDGVAIELWNVIMGFLSDVDRTLLELKYHEHASDEEIAGIFGISEGLVRTRFSRLMKKVRGHLEDRSEYDSLRGPK